ncbi:MAG: hypothetical protein WC699_04265 [Bacteroidales bacterium]|jgi:hypothetical protein
MFIPARYRKYLSTLLLVLFSFYYVNITFFPHSHVVGNMVITHSHFYGGTITTTSQPTHTHSSSTLVIIQELSLFLTVAAAIAFFQFALKTGGAHFYAVLAPSCRNQSQEPIIQLRAPPVILFA